MTRGLLTIASLIAVTVFGAEITGVEVTGEDKAVVSFQGTFNDQVPAWKVNDGNLEITFSGTHLGEPIKQKLDLESPHALVRRLSVYALDEQTTRAKVILNGSLEALRDRIHVGKDGGRLLFSIDYPKGQSAALNLLREEQKPLAAQSEKTVINSGKGYGLTLAILILTLLGAGAATFFFTKFLRKKGGVRGSRKFLIEQLGYCALGTKTGVSLLKVGNEFVLVGVTPGNVNFLSNLPRLQEQYDEEASFERGVFKESIAEEVRRLK